MLTGKFFDLIAWEHTNTVQSFTHHQIVALVQILAKCCCIWTWSFGGIFSVRHRSIAAMGPITSVWRYCWLGLHHQVLTMCQFSLRDLEETKTKLLMLAFLQEPQVTWNIIFRMLAKNDGITSICSNWTFKLAVVKSFHRHNWGTITDFCNFVTGIHKWYALRKNNNISSGSA